MIKKGDTVTIRDASYMRGIRDGKLVAPRHLDLSIIMRLQYTVVETGCAFPFVDDIQTKEYQNDTILVGIEGDMTGKVLFICSQLLVIKDRTHTIYIDNKRIEVSHESFLNLKKQLAD